MIPQQTNRRRSVHHVPFIFGRILGGFLLSLLPYFPIAAVAQAKHSFAAIDSLSYQAWQRSDWKRVNELTREGLQSGFDWYYLRMRAGAAEMGLHHPVSAERHYRRALEFNDKDPVALGCLYESYLFSGKLPEARLLARDFQPVLRRKLGIPVRRLISCAFVESGYMVNPSADSLRSFRPDADASHLYLIPSYWYVSAGAGIEAGSRFSATISANMLSFRAYQQFIFGIQTPLELEVPYDQRSVYLSGACYLGKGFRMTLSGQAMTYTLPLYHWESSESGGGFVATGDSYTDLALGTSLEKRFPYFSLTIQGDANRFKNIWYTQAGAAATLYPAGNINTWFRLSGTWCSDSSRFVMNAAAGRKLFGRAWLEGEYWYGSIRNYSESNSYVVFNNFDLITSRVGASLLVYRLLPHLDLAVRYQYSLRRAAWQTYSGGVYVTDINRVYPVHSIIGGLTWQF